jgi:hypothetical protein
MLFCDVMMARYSLLYRNLCLDYFLQTFGYGSGNAMTPTQEISVGLGSGVASLALGYVR